MPEYRRVYVDGGTFFFTVVTYDRRPLFVNQIARELYFSSISRIQYKHPFEQIAYCILPDHIHCIWALPDNDHDYSLRWKLVKSKFSFLYQYRFGKSIPGNESRKKRGEVGIWQRRFWEHTIQDENDLNNHIDYIHYNPVNHGLVDDVVNWKWSSYHQFESEGYYDDPCRKPIKVDGKNDYGE
jgi:REP-associated tyrosine transposase